VVTRKGCKLVTMPLARTAGPSVWLMTGFNTLSNTSDAG